MILNPFDDRRERSKTKIAITYIVLIAFNIAAWAWAWTAFADRPSLLGTAFLAYMFGLRHAFDVDHIAAIDNVVRKLMHGEETALCRWFLLPSAIRPSSCFASIVIAATAAAMQSRLDSFHDIGGVIGTAVSAAFLLLIGIANLFVLKGGWSAFNRGATRRGSSTKTSTPC